MVSKSSTKRSLVASASVGLVLMAALAAYAHSDEHKAHSEYISGELGDPGKPFRVVELSMMDGNGTMAYAPAEVDVKKDEQIKFVIKNSGTLDHEFFLDSFEKNAAHKIEMQKNPEMEHDDPNAVRLASGKQTEILWKFSTAGTFEFACLIPGHYEAGMHGKVVVK